jgi:hypothetical protein
MVVVVVMMMMELRFLLFVLALVMISIIAMPTIQSGHVSDWVVGQSHVGVLVNHLTVLNIHRSEPRRGG